MLRAGRFPLVPCAYIYDDVTRLHRDFSVVQDQHALARHKEPVVYGLSLMTVTGEEILTAPIPSPPGRNFLRFMGHHNVRVFCCVIVNRTPTGFNDAHMSTVRGTWEVIGDVSSIVFPR